MKKGPTLINDRKRKPRNLKNKLQYIYLVLALMPFMAIAQPALTPLLGNPYLANHKFEAANKPKSNDTLLTLPFIEDFSGVDTSNADYPGLYGYPDYKKFVDSTVFVNPDYCIGPPTIGCATFDGLNKKGDPYSFVITPIPYGPADRLTSKNIDLSTYTAADSLYFSFLYQPQGQGDAPEDKDSLTLWFFNQSTNAYEHVWAVEGTYLDTFKLVMIPIKQSYFFNNGFRFQFRNYATLSGSFDHWNVDYIYLNTNRSKNDTTFNDVGFVYKAPTMLRYYQHMPFNQYTSLDYNGKIKLTQTNISSTNRIARYRYLGNYNLSGNPPCDQTITDNSQILQPVYTAGYNNFSSQNSPDLLGCSFSSPLPTDTTFRITHIFQDTISALDLIPRNDTVIFDQLFSDYYAYDDGTAEAGFYIQTQGGGSYAMRFALNFADTLRAVHMNFVKSVEDVSSREFYLRVWAPSIADPDKPGDVIYEKQAQFPQYADSLNKFVTYTVDSIFTLPVGNFFVGWYQPQDYRINLGFDKNTDHSAQSYYKVANSGWQNSTQFGSTMLRPVVGDSIINPLGISEPQQVHILPNIYLYPNPAGSTFTVGNLGEFNGKPVTYSIFNMLGAQLDSGRLTGNQIDITTLQNGLYFVRFDSHGQSATRKLIIAH